MTGSEPPSTVIQADGRVKAFRPLPDAERRAAFRAGTTAYEAGDYFQAHERLEPAWMGTADPAERALLQGLIKLAAADVHRVRRNPRGVVRNLEGALERLRFAVAAPTIDRHGLDLPALVADVEARLAAAHGGRDPGAVSLTWSDR